MGEDETRNAQAFRTLSSLVHKSDLRLARQLLAQLFSHSSTHHHPLISSNV